MRRIFAAADCRKTSLKEINAVWGEASSKVAGAAAPDNKPGTDAGRVCQKALHDAEPTKHTQTFTEGKGLGLGIENLFYLLKNRLFRQAAPSASAEVFSL